MALAFPTAMLLMALALPIIAFYILKVRLRRVPVSTNLFWRQIYEEKPPRSIWQHLRHLLSLLVQLLILLAVVSAIADPYFSWQMRQAQRLVVVVDHSASMRATDVSPSRFEAARQAARDLTHALGERDEVAVVVAGSRPVVAVGMTTHGPTLRRAIDEIVPSDGPTNLAAAIALGRQLIGDHPHGRLVVLTDGCGEGAEGEPDAESDAESAAESSPPVQYRIFASTAANVGITQFQARRSFADPLGYEILTSVKNASDQPIQCRLEITLNDVPVDVIPLDLQPEQSWSRSLEKTSLEGGRLLATLTQIAPGGADESSDGAERRVNHDFGASLNHLAADDTAWAILPPRQVQRVVVVSDNLFLRTAFSANPLVDLEVQASLPEPWPDDAILVLHGEVPEQLPAGNLFVVDPSAACDLWDLGDVLLNPIITEQAEDSPLMTHIRLDNVMMPEARQLKFHAPAQVLAEALSGDPVYAQVTHPAGKCLVLSANLERSDLAFRTTFPIMVTNALNWFAGENGELRPSLPTGTVTRAELGELSLQATSSLLLRSPSGVETPLASPQQADPAADASEPSISGTLGPLDEVGVWTVIERRGDGGEHPVSDHLVAEYAVNLANPQESDLRPAEKYLQSEAPLPQLAGWFHRPLWFYLVAAACALTSAEWFLYQRRLIT